MALRFPRFQTRYPESERNGSPPGGSILVTRAPLSASSIEVIGPAMPQDRSSTSTPSQTPAISLCPFTLSNPVFKTAAAVRTTALVPSPYDSPWHVHASGYIATTMDCRYSGQQTASGTLTSDWRHFDWHAIDRGIAGRLVDETAGREQV